MTYNFDEIVNRSNTYSTQWDYIEDRFGEKDLLPFSISDTDFKIPDEIQKTIAQFNTLGIYGYTRWNHHDFKGAVVNHFEKRMGVKFSEEAVVYSPSVMYTVSILLRELSQNKKNVLTFSPMYDSFYQVVEENELVLIESKLECNNGYFTIDFEDFEAKLNKVDTFLLCSPHNPTGRLWTHEELKRMVELCKEYDVAIVSDEIHMDMNLTNRKHIPILVFKEVYSKLFLVSSASKTFNTPGLVGSFALLPDKQVRERFLTIQKCRDFLNSASTLGMMATMTAYNECGNYIDEMCTYIDKNLSYVESFINTYIPELHYKKAEATYLAWIDCRKMPFTMSELQEILVQECKIGIMNGKIYGSENYLRMNCGAPFSKIEEGMNRLLKAFEILRAKNN